MKKLLQKTWVQVVLVYVALFLLMWIGWRHASSSELASVILCIVALLFSIAYAVYAWFRSGKMSTRPKWWLDFVTDEKYKSEVGSQKSHDPLPQADRRH